MSVTEDKVLSIVIPCYNEKDNILNIVKLVQASPIPNKEIIVVDDSGAVAFTVEGKLAWGHCLHILDPMGRHIATVKQQVFTFLPKFDLYIGEQCVGTICKEFTFLRPSFTLDCKGWRMEGSFMEWDYTILDAQNRQVATVSKELFHWTDTYVIDVAEEQDALYALMIVLAIDAEKCSRN